MAEHYSDDDLLGEKWIFFVKLAGGNRNRDIADKLFVSEETVKGPSQAPHGKTRRD